MQAMRDLLRSSLARSLDALSPLDRLGAAWPVAAGHAIAERTFVSGYEDGLATVTVPDATWQAQMLLIRSRLLSELSAVSRLPLTDILFVYPEAAAPRKQSTTAGPASTTARPTRKKQ